MTVAAQISMGLKAWIIHDGHRWDNSSVSQVSFFNRLAQLRSLGKGRKAIACVTLANIQLAKESHMAKLSIKEWYKELQIYVTEGMN